ncbi:hypothetical protein H0H87_007344 [Tephrocybe sp. NHM501043]|nr:hypothetical protein H0H87_007344 [Tephrocybe sp. NHM501043]
MKPPVPSQSAYHVELLSEPSNFRSVDNLEIALNDLADYLTQKNYERVLTDLLEYPLATELVLSSIHDSLPLKQWILEDFPKSSSAYDASFASKLLNHLSMFFTFQSLPTIDENDFINIIPRVAATPKLLSFLASLHFGIDQEERSIAQEDVESMPHYFKAKTKQKQSRRGANKQVVRAHIDPKIMSDSKITTPRSREECDEAISKVLSNTKGTLDVLLEILRSQPVAGYIHKTLLSANDCVSIPVHAQTQSEMEPVETIKEQAPVAYPMVQPIKS